MSDSTFEEQLVLSKYFASQTVMLINQFDKLFDYNLMGWVVGVLSALVFFFELEFGHLALLIKKLILVPQK